MKKCSFLLMLSLMVTSAFAQEVNFEIRPSYTRPIKMETLKNAKTMSDICPGFPKAWIDVYHSSELTVMNNGTKFSGLALNDTLSPSQRRYLQKADMGSDVDINVIYSTSNPVTNEKYQSSISFSLTVIPEKEAICSVGDQNLRDFIKKNAIAKFSSFDGTDFQQAILRFTINENGRPTNVQFSKASGFDGIDKLLLEAIHQMPKWNPAENTLGQKVKQEFELRVGTAGIGC